MKKKLNIGILGCANIAKKRVIPNMIESGEFEVIAVSSRSENKANEFSKLFNCDAVVGYQNLLERKDIEAVYIPLPTGLHYKWIKNSLNNGMHVFSEKSFTCSFDETNDLIDLADKKELCVFENFMFPFHSQFETVNRFISGGEIGDLKLLRSSFGFPIFDREKNIRYKKDLGGGALLDAGAYTLKAAQLLLGKEQIILASSLENEGNEVDFQGSILLKNETGIVSQLAFGFDNYYQNNIELWGNKGKLIIDRAFTAGPGFSPTLIIEKQDVRTEYTLEADNHFIKILTAFANAIQSGNYSFQYDEILSQSRLITESLKHAKVE